MSQRPPPARTARRSARRASPARTPFLLCLLPAAALALGSCVAALPDPAIPPEARPPVRVLRPGPEGRLELTEFLLLESAREEKGHLDLDGSTPGSRAYRGGLLPPAGGPGPRMYTFAARFRLEPALRGEELSLYLGPSEYPLRIYLDGIELLRRGRDEGGAYNSSLRSAVALYLPPELLRYGDEENRLVLEAYPRGEVWGLDRYYVDRRDRVSAAVFLRNFVGIDLVKGAFVLAMVIGFYFLGLFLFGQMRRPSYLLFAGVCLSFCLSYFNMAIHHEANDEVLLEALSKGGLVLLSSSTLAFVCEFSSVLNRRRALPLAYFAVGLGFALLVITRGSKQAILASFGLAVDLVIVPQLILDIGILAYALIRLRNRQALTLLAAFAIVIATAGHDVVHLGSMRIPYAWLTAYGYIAVVLAIFGILVNTYRQYERRASNDWLTGLANRQSFDAALAREVEHSRRGGDCLSLLMMDVDFFKAYNDNYGHLAGDQCLRSLGRLIDATIARPADLAARYGGEEFAAILPATDLAGARALAERLRAAVEGLGIPHAASAAADRVTISIGVVSLRCGTGLSLERIVEAADQELYRAKAAGRNRVMSAQLGEG